MQTKEQFITDLGLKSNPDFLIDFNRFYDVSIKIYEDRQRAIEIAFCNALNLLRNRIIKGFGQSLSTDRNAEILATAFEILKKIPLDEYDKDASPIIYNLLIKLKMDLSNLDEGSKEEVLKSAATYQEYLNQSTKNANFYLGVYVILSLIVIAAILPPVLGAFGIPIMVAGTLIASNFALAVAFTVIEAVLLISSLYACYSILTAESPAFYQAINTIFEQIEISKENAFDHEDEFSTEMSSG